MLHSCCWNYNTHSIVAAAAHGGTACARSCQNPHRICAQSNQQQHACPCPVCQAHHSMPVVRPDRLFLGQGAPSGRSCASIHSKIRELSRKTLQAGNLLYILTTRSCPQPRMPAETPVKDRLRAQHMAAAPSAGERTWRTPAAATSCDTPTPKPAVLCTHDHETYCNTYTHHNTPRLMLHTFMAAAVPS